MVQQGGFNKVSQRAWSWEELSSHSSYWFQDHSHIVLSYKNPEQHCVEFWSEKTKLWNICGTATGNGVQIILSQGSLTGIEILSLTSVSFGSGPRCLAGLLLALNQWLRPFSCIRNIYSLNASCNVWTLWEIRPTKAHQHTYTCIHIWGEKKCLSYARRQ